MRPARRRSEKLKTIGLGIIGLGYVGTIHLQHNCKLDNARFVAASDVSKKALRKARDLGVRKTYLSYEELLRDPEVEAVVIALPTHLHVQCAKQAAEAKKHIFLEKPIARNPDEANDIIAVSRRNSVKLMVGYPMRFRKDFQDLKTEIESGALGDIEIAQATYISSGPFFHRAEHYSPVPVPEWWFNKELTGGGALMDIGSHLINLLRWYLGEVRSIKSWLGYRLNMELEDSAVCLADFESGTKATISVGWFSQTYDLEIKLCGTTKTFTSKEDRQNPLATAIQKLATGTSKFHRPHLLEMQYFVECLIHDLSPSPSGEDGLRDLEAIHLAYKSQIDGLESVHKQKILPRHPRW